jgi:hypothetical protein
MNSQNRTITLSSLHNRQHGHTGNNLEEKEVNSQAQHGAPGLRLAYTTKTQTHGTHPIGHKLIPMKHQLLSSTVKIPNGQGINHIDGQSYRTCPHVALCI